LKAGYFHKAILTSSLCGSTSCTSCKGEGEGRWGDIGGAAAARGSERVKD